MSVLDDVRIDVNTNIVFYPYQTAKVLDIFEDLDRKDYAELERQLLDATGQELPNNKYVFVVPKSDGSPMYLWFYDDWLWVGNKIVIGQR